MLSIEIIQETIKDATSLDEIQGQMVSLLRSSRENGVLRIGYVAGSVASDGEEHVERNLGRLMHWTELIGNMYDFPIICAAFVFNQDVYARIEIPSLPYEKRSQLFFPFWRAVLQAGVTDIFMAQGWEKSVGAKDEHETAQALGINIHFIFPGVV